MAEQIPVVYAVNLLEAPSIVTVTGTAAGSSKDRLFDRDITLPWTDSGTAGSRIILIDQGAGGTQAITTWVLAAPHNLAVSSTIESSHPDSSSWIVRDTFTPTPGTAVRRSFASITARYWRLVIASPASAPVIPEFFLTVPVPLPKGPHPDGASRAIRPNVVRHESVGGYVWKTRRGGSRWAAEWPMRLLTDAQRQTFETLLSTLNDASRPFWVEDTDGTLRWAEWTNPAEVFAAIAQARQSTTLIFGATV